MNAEQWNRIKELVPDALDLPAHERDAFLDRACRTEAGTLDLDLRREAAGLIAASLKAEAEDALHSPVRGIASEAAQSQGLQRHPMPDRVGPWRPVRQLGSGGMGVVYEAVRADESFTQKAALKLIRPGFVSDFRDRFIRERALLAGLVHPGIARLLDGGLAGDGTPYLAMELVEGRALTTYASDNQLTIDERLALFLQACEAVAYAHRNLVVHRDLKPPNIYVHESGEQPVVKLLDFGIARLLESEDPILTVTGTGPLTPAYAAPEQLRGEPITTATDVYALGVVLYELLTDQRPYDLEHKTAAQTEQIVCTTIPKPPSSVAAQERHRRRVQGDLDQIVLKALKKEPERRYDSAQALGDDIRRYLARLPVLAQPDDLSYRFRKFVQRNRSGVLVAGSVLTLIVVLVTAFTLGLARERNRAEAAAQEAISQAERAQAIAGFLERILRAPNQRWYNQAEATGPNTPVKAVLDEAARQIDQEFGDRPDLQADLHHILGDTYTALGLSEEAVHHHRQVLALREQLYRPPHPKLAEALYYASLQAPSNMDMIMRIERLRQAIAMQRVRNEGNNFPFMIIDLVAVLIPLQEIEEADSLNKEALDFVEAVFIPGHDGYRYRDMTRMGSFRQRAQLKVRNGEIDEAEGWMIRSDSLFQRMGEGIPAFLRWRLQHCTWGRLFFRQGRYGEAEKSLLTCRGEDAPRGQTPPFPKPENYDSFPRGAPTPDQSGQAALDLIHLYEAWGRPADADPYREEARRYHQRLDSLRATYHRWLASPES